MAGAKQNRWFAIGARVLVVASALVMFASIGKVAATRAASAATTASIDAGQLRTALLTEAPVVDAGAPVPAPPPPMTSSARASPDDPVFVNYASAEQLQRLPGVGAKRAEAIVALRGRLGRFQRVEDLMRVKGIGRATIKKLRPLVRLGTPEAGAS